jgi:hypothetical protein
MTAYLLVDGTLADELLCICHMELEPSKHSSLNIFVPFSLAREMFLSTMHG